MVLVKDDQCAEGVDSLEWFALEGWYPSFHRAVNKRDLSTGETRELAGNNLGFGLNPGVESATPRSLISNRREGAASKNLRNVGDTGESGGWRCCQDNGRVNL